MSDDGGNGVDKMIESRVELLEESRRQDREELGIMLAEVRELRQMMREHRALTSEENTRLMEAIGEMMKRLTGEPAKGGI